MANVVWFCLAVLFYGISTLFGSFNAESGYFVESHPIYNLSSARTNPELRVEEITENGAILKWRPYNNRQGAQYSGDIFIAYRPYKQSAEWKWSKPLNISTSRYVLSHLRFGQEYEAKLAWAAKTFGIDHSTFASVEFKTKMATVVSSSPATDKSRQIKVVVGVVVSVCILLVIAFILVILWRRRSRRLRSNFAGYENKSFGMQLSESHKRTTRQLKA